MTSITPVTGIVPFVAPSGRSISRSTDRSPAYILDFSPLAYTSPSPYDSAGGDIVHLGPRPELLAELDAARLAQKDALDAELQAKEDARTGKTIKPFTLKEFLEKMDEKFDLYAAQRREKQAPETLTNDERAILRADRLGPLWKKRFRWFS
ncbi:hypothetical protein [Elstera cyanobacteriorum]|uniref:hypothetical protein n=1 Tax=Elstera cyanobacteriorum TaxID=2022747 RepID=UPI0023559081|nr:hypothetical protein [Elstera cyanobacteriorum]MCK6444523.1 hypothetical protein [Elstera cyanobacteriorum]